MNILDYLDWRGDLLLSERPFNEVDNLILSTLVYLNMDGLVPEDPRASIALSELPDAYRAAGYDQSRFLNDPLPLLEKAVRTPRFSSVRVGRYVNRIDAGQLIQFAAATYYLDDGTAYIAFRGTDDTIVGWREDFNFGLLTETPGQSESVAYLDAVASDTACPLRVGGHSKGGNFAVYAASFCKKAIKERILSVYSNDGPGFVHSIVDSEGYSSIVSRIQKIIPESSLVGILLSGREHKRVIKSSARGIFQHNPYSWSIVGTKFDPADARSPGSLFMDETLSRWFEKLSDTQKADLISAIFDSLEASGVSTLSELKENPIVTYNAIKGAIKKIDPETQSEVLDTMRKLLLAGRDVLLDELHKKLDLLEQVLPKPNDSHPDRLP